MDHHHHHDELTVHAWRLSPTLVAFAVPLAIVGVLLLVLGFASVLVGDAKTFFLAYLQSYTLLLAISLGALFFIILQHLTKSGWSVVVRRVAEYLSLGVIPLAVLFLPIAYTVVTGNAVLFPWLDPPAEEAAILANKAAYLNPGFFLIRAGLYFFAWIVMALYYHRQSLAQDQTGDKQHTINMQWWAPLGMYSFAFTSTFAAVDWLMTLAPLWFSTMWGVYFFAGSNIAFLSSLILCVLVLRRMGMLTEVTAEHFHDLGKLLFGFNCFWGYIAFSQYMLIWYANIPEETTWVIARQNGGWGWVALFIVFGHFVIPFIGMLNRPTKRNPATLGFWAAWLLVMQWVDFYWVILPNGVQSSPVVAGFALVSTLLGAAAIYFAAIIRMAGNQSLIPIGDPRLSSSLAFQNR